MSPAQLDLDDIQGNIVRGYRLRCVAHLFGAVESANVESWRTALCKLLPRVTRERSSHKPESGVNIGISHAGLTLLLPDLSQALVSFRAYALGMRERAPLLGDVDHAGWEPWTRRHIWITVHASDTTKLEQVVNDVLRDAGNLLSSPLPYGEAIVENDHWFEHFGFRDDVSQPAVAGSPNADRALSRGGGKPNGSQAGSPIAAGEFLLGYPNESGDDVLKGMSSNAKGVLTNSTFAVFRVLLQDVAHFHRCIAANAERWRIRPDDLASKLVGRRPNGDTLSGGSSNYYTYEDDPKGARCPLGAHVRRVNPRLTGEHRMIRRGMPFGPPLSEQERSSLNGGEEIADVKRGLYFVGLNASIENQFEFVQASWMNQSAGILPGSCDPLAGAENGHGRIVIEGGSPPFGDPVVLQLPRFVSCEGGQYYLIPGIRGLRQIAGLDQIRLAPRPSSPSEQV